jgi:hypothetical protein
MVPRTYRIPVIKLKTNPNRHEKQESLLLIKYKILSGSKKYIK